MPIAQGWKDISYDKINWPQWIDVEAHDEGIPHSAWRHTDGAVLVRWNPQRRWILYNAGGSVMGRGAPGVSAEFPLQFLSDVAPELAIPAGAVQSPPQEKEKTPMAAAQGGKVRRAGRKQTEIENDGTWVVEEEVEALIAADDDEVRSASKTQADLALKIISLERARTRVAHDYNVKIKAAKGEAEAAARIVHTEQKVVMVPAKVHFDPSEKTKRAVATAHIGTFKKGDVVWTQPMTKDELESGPTAEGGGNATGGDLPE